ncbi:tRNA (adenine-N1)-methyltransferase [Candidatus Bathyarchaeota archaeon]|nr:tRNA (adenine-N1)-methyltransferase [Candidatus Bathyarchaeota archaeon]
MTNQKISNGDYVLLSLDAHKTYLVKMETGKEFHTHKGLIKLDDLIGKEFGSTIRSNLDTMFTALEPLLSDYMMKSSRRTQITYPKDVSLIIMFSGIGEGSQVVEAGTGTGALTTAIAHYVKPGGRVYSYDVREEFQKTAEKNLIRANLKGFVELKTKDITTGIDEQNLDGIILDLATPWLVVPHAYDSLKPSKTIVSFSPTIDQVVKTTEALTEIGFVSIETVECLMRRMQIKPGRNRPQTLMTGHTGYITHARKAIFT